MAEHIDERLRIITFNIRPDAYLMTLDWATRHGHRIVLLVTTPGPAKRRSEQYRDTIAAAPPSQEILITTRPQRLAPLIARLEPDLIISGSFPYRIPPEVVTAARLGGVNLHPAPLPRYRGPNPVRQVFDGHDTVSATLHRISPEFDAGPILSQQHRPLPADLTPETIYTPWSEVIVATFEEGLARAIAGEPGTPQDERQATYAGAFIDDECWLDWREPTTLLLRRFAALRADGHIVRAELDGLSVVIERLTPMAVAGKLRQPSTGLEQASHTRLVQTGDGTVQVVAGSA